MSQPAETPLLNWPNFQARLLYSARGKAVNAPKRREIVKKRIVAEDDLK
jgi:hypothetical protein